MTHPYHDLPERAFWSPAVGRRDALEIDQLWQPKWPVRPRHGIATFGSCFAQHFGRALAERGYRWMQTECPPCELPPDTEKSLNYRVFTARTGNIYTVSLLHQWVAWSLGEASPPDEVWEGNRRFYDPFRPAIEPDGFANRDEVLASRDLTIEAFGDAVRKADIFVFTLGLTESWWNGPGDYEYPMCPGTVAGRFDPDQHVFRNQDYGFIEARLLQALKLIRGVNPRVRVLLTVSPVPLTATKSDAHVLVATTWSKSVLRAVAGQTAARLGFVDYFPSYEIIASAPFGGRFYEDNKRGVKRKGVDHVMATFFADQDRSFPQFARRKGQTAVPRDQRDDLVCEEELLSAFGPGEKR